VETTIERWVERLPSSAPVLRAFKEVLAQEADLRSEIDSARQDACIYADAEAYRRGVPVLGREAFAVTAPQAKWAAARLIPALKQGFPAVAQELDKISGIIEDPEFDLCAALGYVVHEQGERLRELSGRLGVDEQTLSLTLSRILKPFAVNIAAAIPDPPQEFQWREGYCPICGSQPCLSVVRPPHGERSLVCSFCSHEWRFIRTACPFCRNEDFDALETIYVEDRESEFAALCRKCMKYIPGIDLRKTADDPALDVAPFALTYLDVIAQDNGFRPGAAERAAR
jgi:FdhE protein